VTRQLLCAVLALAVSLTVGASPCRAEPPAGADSAKSPGPAVQQPSFCFQGSAPDQQERSAYAARAQRDALRVSQARAGDLDETAFIVILVIASVAVIGSGIYLTAHGL